LHTVRNRKHLAAWVNLETHQRFRALARERGVSIACLLGELVDDALDGDDADARDPIVPDEPRREYLTTRLRPGDVKMIGRRAAIRRMKPATYIAALVRSHLVADPPLPPAELAVLERAAAEVSAIGRNLNQIARAINSGAPVPHGTASVIGQSIEAVEAVREAAKAYVRVAVASWEAPLG
jgi:hypothetical protein